eukprot:03782_4
MARTATLWVLSGRLGEAPRILQMQLGRSEAAAACAEQAAGSAAAGGVVARKCCRVSILGRCFQSNGIRTMRTSSSSRKPCRKTQFWLTIRTTVRMRATGIRGGGMRVTGIRCRNGARLHRLALWTRGTIQTRMKWSCWVPVYSPRLRTRRRGGASMILRRARLRRLRARQGGVIAAMRRRMLLLRMRGWIRGWL